MSEEKKKISDSSSSDSTPDKDQDGLDHFWEETKIREVASSLIQPVIKVQKQNTFDINRHGTDLKDMQKQIDTIATQLAKIQKDSDHVPQTITRVSELEQAFEVSKRKTKIQTDQVIEKIKMSNDRINDVQSEFQRIEHMLAIRDTKIEQNFEIFQKYKEKINTDICMFNDKVSAEQEKLWMKLTDLDLEFKNTEHFFKSSRDAIDSFSQKIVSLQYELDKKSEQNDEFMEKDFKQALERIQKVESQLGNQSLYFNDVYQQMRITEVRIQPYFNRIETIEGFIEKALPFMINLHISDYLQEILGVQDKVKLVQYDNKKVKELQNYVNSKPEDVLDDEQLEQYNQIKNSTDKKHLSNSCVTVLTKRMEVLINFLATQEKGLIRFEYGREFQRYMPEEKVDYLDKGIAIRLDNYAEYLQKAVQMLKNEQKIQQQKIQQITSQTNPQAETKPGQVQERIIKEESVIHKTEVINNTEVKFFKEIVLVRTKKKKHVFQEIIESRRKRSQQIKARNQQKQMLDKLIEEQKELESEVEEASEDDKSDYNIYMPEDKSSPISMESTSPNPSLGDKFTFFHRPISRVSNISPDRQNLDLLKDQGKNESKFQKQKTIKGKEKKSIISNNSQSSEDKRASLSNQIKDRIQMLLDISLQKNKKLAEKINKIIVINREQSIAQNQALTIALERVKKSREEFADQVDYIDQNSKKMLQEYAEKVEGYKKDIEQFQKVIETEYIDFFKNKKRIRTEISVLTKETNDKIDSFQSTLDQHSRNHETINQSVPLIVETLHLMIESVKKDNELREQLSQSLKFSEVSNEGYLLLDSSNPILNKTPLINSSSQLKTPIQVRASTAVPKESANLSNSLAAANLQQSFQKISQTNPDQPIPESFHGALFMRKLTYREKELSLNQVMTLLDNFIQNLEQNIHKQSILTSKNLIPKRFFDDYYLENFGNSIIAAIQRPSTTSHCRRILVPTSAGTNTLISNQAVSIENLGMTVNFPKSRNTTKVTKSTGITDNNITNQIIDRTTLIDQLERKTKKLLDYDKDRDQMISKYLNKTFETIQKGQLITDYSSLGSLENIKIQQFNIPTSDNGQLNKSPRQNRNNQSQHRPITSDQHLSKGRKNSQQKQQKPQTSYMNKRQTIGNNTNILQATGYSSGTIDNIKIQ